MVLKAFLLSLCLSGCQEEKQAYTQLETVAVEEAVEETHLQDEETSEEEEQNGENLQDETVQETAAQDQVYVYVCGCVQDPGVYLLDSDARIYEAVEAAGGMTESAYEGSVNLAQVVEDQMQIYIPSEEEVLSGTSYPQTEDSSSSSGTSVSADTSDKININTATASELTELPGIGTSKAEAIVSYREENGDFSSIEEIMNISGIKEGVFAQIEDYITVD